MTNNLHPMVPLVTGFLAGTMSTDGREAMKIVTVRPGGIDAFDIEFASGLVLRVTVAEKGGRIVADAAPMLLRALKALIDDVGYECSADDCECGQFDESAAVELPEGVFPACCHTRAHAAIARAEGRA